MIGNDLIGIVGFQDTVAKIDLHARYGSKFSVAEVKLLQRRQVDVGHVVAIGHEKAFLAAQVLCNAPNSAALFSVLSGIYERDLPRWMVERAVEFDVRVGALVIRFRQVNGEIALHGLILEKVAPDLFGLETEREQEPVVSVSGKNAHHVPDDGPLANFDQLFLGQRIAPHARALPAAKNNYRNVAHGVRNYAVLLIVRCYVRGLGPALFFLYCGAQVLDKRRVNNAGFCNNTSHVTVRRHVEGRIARRGAFRRHAGAGDT